LSTVDVEDRGPVRVLWLDRPARRNALSAALLRDLIAHWDRAEADAAVHAVVLAGRGGTFCSGGDLSDGLDAPGALAAHEGRGLVVELFLRFARSGTPVVAAVEGAALGGGCGLMAATDLVVAASDARIGLPEIRLALFPWIVLAVLRRDVPRKVLFEWAMTGEPVDAARAREVGLVNRVVAPGTAVDEAVTLATSIAGRSPAIVAMGKRAFHGIADASFEDALRTMHGNLTVNLLSEDASEGVAAFLERRSAVWKGR
jgi:enoyl-CoA hydratase/carnithine racemase